MQAAKQIRLSRNDRRSAALSSWRSPNTESIQRKQKSALRLIDGMFRTASNAANRSASSGT
jgi:hypothetical protein